MVRNAELAALFEEMADHLELREESVFRIRAYRRAAQQLEGLAEDAVGVLETGGKIPGIGADLSKKIREYADAGAIAELEAMRQSLPAGVRQLMAVPGVGPRTAKLLYDRLGIDSVEALEAACRSGRVLEVPGVREKTRDNMLRGVQTWKAGQARMPLGRALSLGEGIMASLREVPGV